MWETDYGTDEDGRSFKEFAGEGDMVGFHTSGCYIVLSSDGETSFYFVVGHGGVEEGVINHLGEVGKGNFEACWACHFGKLDCYERGGSLVSCADR